MTREVDQVDGLADAILQRFNGERFIVCLAGAPGSGKSTFAEKLVEKLNVGHAEQATLLPMDGYHYDDIVLDDMGRKARKGASDTFDVGGLDSILHRLRGGREDRIAAPIFDRSIEIARAGARLIPLSTRLIVVEGNYLLLDDEPWIRLRQHFDVSVFIDVPEDILRERLMRRWLELNFSQEAARKKVEENDLLNARMVISNSSNPDIRIDGTRP
ncbi:Panthothenate kinase [Cohaesibacter sp. ES.047]|uniref:nucleoside triphosphate hydrolase n=1 Tax=Cohaesibacter sp. ES.047 TaxID=1798205 RepID=UPI000BB8C6A5|nr:nucleoside triphosphate hydrolase [Cohaesibacter sp. ES.047]SNY92574.1 Panthothenate kinase [Cohaesibacter sp. ES.047]